MLPSETTIRYVYQEHGNSLLILGEPGSGKTTTLLDLARSLLNEAAADNDKPVPVVFHLSTWSNRFTSLFDWLVEELKVRYQIPRWQAQRWLKKGRLILLLDALDEVSAKNRPACVEAIKRYDNPIPGLTMCSRLEEYTALPVRVNLNAAICLQPLSLEQVQACLTSAGPRIASLQQSIIKDPDLLAMLQSPLMLSVAILASANSTTNIGVTTTGTTQEERRAAIFDSYIERMFQRKLNTALPYPKEKTLIWLCWLARKMIDHSEGQSIRDVS